MSFSFKFPIPYRKKLWAYKYIGEEKHSLWAGNHPKFTSQHVTQKPFTCIQSSCFFFFSSFSFSSSSFFLFLFGSAGHQTQGLVNITFFSQCWGLNPRLHACQQDLYYWVTLSPHVHSSCKHSYLASNIAAQLRPRDSSHPRPAGCKSEKPMPVSLLTFPKPLSCAKQCRKLKGTLTTDQLIWRKIILHMSVGLALSTQHNHTCHKDGLLNHRQWYPTIMLLTKLQPSPL
jgi:hypothetical protein